MKTDTDEVVILPETLYNKVIGRIFAYPAA